MAKLSPVLIIANDAGGTGSVASVVRNHVREIGRARPVILVSQGLPEPIPPGLQAVRIEVSQLRWMRRLAHVPREILFLRAALGAARRLCREQAIGAVMAHSHALAYFVGRRIRDEFGVPCLLFVHADIHDRPAGTYDPLLTAFYRWVTPRAYRTADRVLAISQQIAGAAVRYGAKAEKIHIVPNGIDPTEIGLENAGPPVDPYLSTLQLLYVGRLSVEKGVPDLIDACIALKKKGVDFHLIIAGDGPLRSRLESQARHGGIDNRVRFIGAQPRERLGALYRAAHILCVPSLSEPQGIVVLEALISGTPVVASDVGGIREMVANGINGALHSPRAPDEIANLIATLAADPIRRSRLAECANPSVISRYAWEAIGSRISSLLDQ